MLVVIMCENGRRDATCWDTDILLRLKAQWQARVHAVLGRLRFFLALG